MVEARAAVAEIKNRQQLLEGNRRRLRDFTKSYLFMRRLFKGDSLVQSEMQSISIEDVKKAAIDVAIQEVDQAVLEGQSHVLTTFAKVLLNEVMRQREAEQQRLELAKRWFISSAAATRTELGLPPRVPLSNEDYF